MHLAVDWQGSAKTAFAQQCIYSFVSRSLPFATIWKLDIVLSLDVSEGLYDVATCDCNYH